MYNITGSKKEMYRSGRNELDSKSSCRVTGTWVRIPPSPLLENPCKQVGNAYLQGFLPVYKGNK